MSLIENHVHQYAIRIHEEQHYVVTTSASSSTAAMLQNVMMMTSQHHHGAAAHGSSSGFGIGTALAQQQQHQQTTMPLLPLPTCLVWIFPLLTAIASCCLFASLFVHSIQSIQQQQQHYNSLHHHHHHSSSLSPETSSLTAAFSSSMGSSSIGIVCSILVVLQCLVPLCLLGCCMVCLCWHVLFSPESENLAAQLLTVVWILSAIGSGYLQCFVYSTLALESED
jgi:hypothetical protein